MKGRQRDTKRQKVKAEAPRKEKGGNNKGRKPENLSKQKKDSGFSIFRLFTGLTFSEWLRLKKLKKSINEKGKDRTPSTAQQTITFKKMYLDGTCKVNGNYYTRMVRFDDLNYCLQDVPMQAEILGMYSQFINYFEPGIHFQVFLFNRRVSESSLISRFDIPLQGDRFDTIRREFSDILKNQCAKGNNGVVKEKYIIFGIEANSLKEARVKLKNIETDVIRNLANMGTKARALNGRERVELLHEFYHQDTMEPLHFSYKDMTETGNSVKDYVAPGGFDFRFPSRFKAGKMFGSVQYFDITASQVNDELLQRFLDIDENITISIHMQTMDPVKASKMLKNKLSNIQKMKIDEQKKAVRSGYDMDIMPSDIVTFENDALELINDLNSSNQKIIRMTFLIACFGRTKKDMENLLQRVSGIVQQANCNLRCLQYQQEQGMNAVSPVGVNGINMVRVLTTKSSAIFIPFNTQELFMKGQALYYGLNALSNNMILADRKSLRTPNGVILGTPGSGKSFSAKREIVGCFLITNDDILVCDPEGEYFPLVEALGGQVVKLATNSTDYLNPMDIQHSHMKDREALRLKADFLITLCDMIAGGEEGLANDEKGIIDRCVAKVYEEYFMDPQPEKMPILEDLYNTLLKYEPKDVKDEKLAEDAKKKAVKIAQSLVLYVHGSQNYFNHRTNVDSSNRIVCFDIRDLGSQLKELGMLIVQDAVWNRVSYNREQKKATRYYCDEFHLLLRDKQTAQYSVEMWKRFRKWGGIPTGLTQNVGDFLLSPQIEGILGNSDFIYLLNQNASDQEILAEKLGLSSKQLKYVTNAESGCGLIRFNNVTVPFVDRYPQDTETFRIMNTRPEENKAEPEKGKDMEALNETKEADD